MADTFISAQTLKLLVDSKLESRQKGVRDVGLKTVAVFQRHPPAEAYDVVMKELSAVDVSLLHTASATNRRGGLCAVRAVIGSLPLRNHPREFVELISIIVFGSIGDVDATVRLATLEAAHALVRQLQAQLLDVCFLQVFWGVVSGINDQDGRVVVMATEVSLLLREVITGSDSFRLQTDLFVTFITEVLAPYTSTAGGNEKITDSSVVQWCLEWIDHVLDLPGDELILRLGRFLKPLLMLSGGYRGVQIPQLLHKCLQDIKDAFSRHMNVHLDTLLSIATECVEESEDSMTRKNALEWILELLNIDTNELNHLIYKAVMASLSQLGSRDLETRVAAQNVNYRLMQLVAVQQSKIEKGSYDAVLKSVTGQLTGRGTEESRVTAMEWIALVLHTDASVVEEGFTEIFEAVLMMLCDQSAHVIHKCIETLCLISGDTHFDYFISRLVDLFHKKAGVLLPRATTIIKQLQLMYQREDLSQCEKLCLKLSAVLSVHEDKRFLEKLVIALNTMVLTLREFLPLREILRQGVDDERAHTIFLGMYKCWRYNSVAAVSLCLLSRVYEHAFQLIQFMGSMELSAAILLQLERLVCLLEAPVFAHIRISLMEPSKFLPLVQTLFAIQLILPQGSPQYSLLHHRLKIVPNLATLEREVLQMKDAAEKTDRSIDWDELLELAKEAQQCVSDFERKLLLQRLEDPCLL